MKTQILNSKGEPIVLTPQEVVRAQALQKKFRDEQLFNSLGFELNITTLTAMSKEKTNTPISQELVNLLEQIDNEWNLAERPAIKPRKNSRTK